LPYDVPEIEMDYAIGALGSTNAHPWKMVDNNGKFYIVKFATPTGKTAINELICIKIAKELDLPVFDPVIAIISQDIADNVNQSRDEKINAGKHFALEIRVPFITLRKLFVNGQKYGPNDFSNIHKVVDIAVFDSYIYYDDRHPDNVCVIPGDVKDKLNYYIFDHDLAFRKDNWNAIYLKTISSRSEGFTKFCLNTERITRMSQFDSSWHLIDDLKNNEVHNMIQQLPSEWTNFISDDIKELDNFLTTRSISVLRTIITNSGNIFNKLRLS